MDIGFASLTYDGVWTFDGESTLIQLHSEHDFRNVSKRLRHVTKTQTVVKLQ